MSAAYVVKLRPLDRGPAFVAEWESLEGAAVEGNAFLSPRFVLPALRWLTPKARPLALTVRRGATLVGFGLFEPIAASPRIPAPHLRAYRCAHTYLTGFLLSAGEERDVAAAVFAWARRWRRIWTALEFSLRPGDGPLAEALDGAAQGAGVPWVAYATFDRAALRPAESDPDALEDYASKNQRKKLRRAERVLAEHGDVSYRTAWPSDAEADEVETFLALEAMGWKSDAGSALASTGPREAFFREVVSGFAARGDAYFSQLSAGDTVVASSANFVSGDHGFGFKIGWHTDYADASPGVLHEAKYVETAHADLSRLALVDATSDEGSFVERVWPHRRSVTSGVFCSSRAMGLAVRGARRAKEAVQTRRAA